MKMKLIGFLALLIFIVAAIGGYIANIVKIIGALGGEVTAIFIARCVGVFFAPIGSILGFF